MPTEPTNPTTPPSAPPSATTPTQQEAIDQLRELVDDALQAVVNELSPYVHAAVAGSVGAVADAETLLAEIAATPEGMLPAELQSILPSLQQLLPELQSIEAGPLPAGVPASQLSAGVSMLSSAAGSVRGGGVAGPPSAPLPSSTAAPPGGTVRTSATLSSPTVAPYVPKGTSTPINLATGYTVTQQLLLANGWGLPGQPHAFQMTYSQAMGWANQMIGGNPTVQLLMQMGYTPPWLTYPPPQPVTSTPPPVATITPPPSHVTPIVPPHTVTTGTSPQPTITPIPPPPPPPSPPPTTTPTPPPPPPPPPPPTQQSTVTGGTSCPPCPPCPTSYTPPPPGQSVYTGGPMSVNSQQTTVTGTSPGTSGGPCQPVTVIVQQGPGGQCGATVQPSQPASSTIRTPSAGTAQVYSPPSVSVSALASQDPTLPPALLNYLSRQQDWQTSVAAWLSMPGAGEQAGPVSRISSAPQASGVPSVWSNPVASGAEPQSTARQPIQLQPARPSVFPESSHASGSKVVGMLNVPNWSLPDVCSYEGQWGSAALSARSAETMAWVRQAVEGNPAAGQWSEGLKGLTELSIVGPFFQFVLDLSAESKNILLGAVGSLVGLVTEQLGCDASKATVPLLGEILLGLAEQYVGPEFGEYRQSLTYWRRYVCPQAIPSQAEANAAWLADTIDEDTWTCWTRANNNRVVPAQAVRHAERTQLTRDDYVSLWLRGDLPEEAFLARLRQLGITDGTDVRGVQKLATVLAPVSDVIRFMVRDVGDEALVERHGMDAQFKRKWTGDVEKQGRAQGVGAELAKMYWRAHWSLPSPTQLYQIIHRFRPGPRDTKLWERVKRAVKAATDGPALLDNDPDATIYNAAVALAQDDVLPFWMPYLIYISYRPLTRIDARRAYFAGTLDTDGLTESMLDLGYNPDTAKRLVKFYEREKIKYLLGQEDISAYVDGWEEESAARESLVERGVDQAMTDRVIKAANKRRVIRQNRDCLKILIKDMHKGLVSVADAKKIVHGLGYSPAFADQFGNRYGCPFSTSRKELSLAYINRLFIDGIIPGVQLAVRIMRLGYPMQEAKDIAASLEKHKALKLAADAARLKRQEEAAAERERKRLEKQRKERERWLRRKAMGETNGESPP